MTDRRREVGELQKRILEIDSSIRDQLDARAALSRQIHGLLEGDPAPDASEQDFQSSVLAGASGAMPESSLRAIFGEIRAAGRALERPLRLALVGQEGGFCHLAGLEEFGATTQHIECATVADALVEVIRDRAVYAMFPFESSAEGLAQPALLALAETDLVLVAERVVPAVYDLVSSSPDAGALEKVFMTAVTHAACQRFLDVELPRATLIDVRSPALATELAREGATSGAVVPRRTGQRANLSVLRENVGDLPDLRLRHGIVARRPAMRTGNDVSCLLFSTEDAPGALYEVLRHLAERGINLKKLQSLPVRQGGLEYLFYVEITGHASDRSVVTAFEVVKRTARYFRVLGSFRATS